VNEPENENVGNEYREFDAEDPDCQQEFAEDADGARHREKIAPAPRWRPSAAGPARMAGDPVI